MGDPQKSTKNIDNIFHCAFNFPAVISVLGRENWGQVRDTYMKLTQNNQWKVKKSLSYSLHEVAEILG